MSVLERSDADGVDVLIFEASEIGKNAVIYGSTGTSWGKTRAMFRKTLNRLAAKGVFLFCGPNPSQFATDLDQELRGKDTSYPGDNPHVVCCGSCCPKDFNALDPELSDYIPDSTKPVQSKLKNLVRPVIHASWLQQLLPPEWGYPPPNFMYIYDGVAFGSIIDIASGSGGSDQRFLDVPMDSNTQMATGGIRGSWTGAPFSDWDYSSDPRFQWGPPEAGLKFNIGFSADGGVGVASLYTLGLEAYLKTHNGVKPTGVTLLQKMYKSAWKNVGPATDDAVFTQPNVFDVPPPTKFFYPKTKYQSVMMPDFWVSPTPMEAWKENGQAVQDEIFFEIDWDLQQIVHDTNFDWSRPGKTKALGHGVVNMKAFLIEAIK
jgi:hypothetical protein